MLNRSIARTALTTALAVAFCLPAATTQAQPSLVWMRQWGTHESETGSGVALDGAGNPYLAGLLGTPALQEETHDVFLRRYNADGTLIWNRQFGTTGTDFIGGVAVDATGNAYITGRALDGSGVGADFRVLMNEYPRHAGSWTLTPTTSAAGSNLLRGGTLVELSSSLNVRANDEQREGDPMRAGMRPDSVLRCVPIRRSAAEWPERPTMVVGEQLSRKPRFAQAVHAICPRRAVPAELSGTTKERT